MKTGGWYCCCLLSIVVTGVTGSCESPSPLTLQMILDYVGWRAWDEVVLFDSLGPTNCARNYATALFECLWYGGIRASVHSASGSKLPEVLKITKHRVGAVVLLDSLNYSSTDNVLYAASQKLLYNYYTSWFLITARSTDDVIDSVLRELNIGIDSDVVVSTSALFPREVHDSTHFYLNKTCSALRRYGWTPKFDGSVEPKPSSNATTNLEFFVPKNETMSFYLAHVYKVRNAENSSLVVRTLGAWNPGSYSLKLPISVELRSNFNGIPIVVGVLNGSADGMTTAGEEETSDITPLLDIVNFVAQNVNASVELVPHEKLGSFANKAWTHLLGDVVSGAVDVGLGYISMNDERQREMSFTHPLIRYTRNIYFHPPESGSMRDIFLQPFNNQLLACVATTCLLVVLAMSGINYAAKAALCNEEEKNAGVGEAALWCISIMCMQGSPWSPSSPSGKTILMSSLVFALVIYNAYAGFITSILSVQVSGIRTLSDLLQNNYKVGYSTNDDEYIRNVNDSNLRQLYIKAFDNRESKLDTTLGLRKAAKGGYGFFVSATQARRTLGSTLLHERCFLKELVVPQTFTVVALPMSNACPYKKIINLNILRILEVGAMSRIGAKMLPRMPRCDAPTTFHSARLADVYSAYIILVAGLVVAFVVGLLERIWSQREFLRESLRRSVQIHRRLVREQVVDGRDQRDEALPEHSVELSQRVFDVRNYHDLRQPREAPILRSRSPRRNVAGSEVSTKVQFREIQNRVPIGIQFAPGRMKLSEGGEEKEEKRVHPLDSFSRSELTQFVTWSKVPKKKLGSRIGDDPAVPPPELPVNPAVAFPFQL